MLSQFWTTSNHELRGKTLAWQKIPILHSKKDHDLKFVTKSQNRDSVTWNQSKSWEVKDWKIQNYKYNFPHIDDIFQQIQVGLSLVWGCFDLQLYLQDTNYIKMVGYICPL